MMPAALILASADLPSSLWVPGWLWPAVLAALLLIAASYVVGLFANLAKCYEVFRTKPAAHETYATKDEVANLEQRLLGAMANNQSNADHWRGEMTAKVDQLGKTFQSFTSDLMRAVGRLEGKLTAEPET